MIRRSAVIVRFRLPEPLERVRVRHDPVAAAGVPAHVTILFPFVPTDQLTPAVRRTLAGIAAGVQPFEVRFTRVERFPEVVWLAPEPDEPFRLLTERTVAAFPDHPPYEGLHPEVVPHLTIGHGTGVVLDRLERRVAACPAFEARVRAIEVIAESGAERWHRRWRIPLGASPRGRSTAPSASGRIGREPLSVARLPRRAARGAPVRP
jgi:2'-5' RNA ligase